MLHDEDGRMLLGTDLNGLGIFAVYPKSDLSPKCLYIVCYFLYSCQRVTSGIHVICKIQVSQPLLAPLDSKTGAVDCFNHDKVDGDEEEKRGRETATLPHACINVEHLCISNACFHTAAGVNVKCLEYVDEFVWFQYFQWLTVDVVKCFLEID